MKPRTGLKPKRLALVVASAFILTAVVSPPTTRAAHRHPADLVEVQVGLQEILFQPVAVGGSWEIVLSGPSGIWLRWEVPEGDPSISLAAIHQLAGELPDGLYSWELVRTEATDTQRGGAAPSQVQAGYFSVSRGSIVQPAQETPSDRATRQTINEDLWVIGGLCAGLSCNDAEGFGFEVIRLEDDNNQIDFEDSSSTLAFPTRDWRIKANDTSNGGASYFAIVDQGDDGLGTVIPFRIEAGAPASTLYLEDDGDVGIGTSNPATELHVIGDATIDGDFTVLSSRDAKRDLVPARGDEVLARLDELPIFTWRRTGDTREALHMGPTAEDFTDAFGLGADERHLSPSDAAGVALAAVRELSRRLREQQGELAALRAQNEELSRLLEALQESSAEPSTPQGREAPALVY